VAESIDEALREMTPEILDAAPAGVGRRHDGLDLKEKIRSAPPSPGPDPEDSDLGMVVIDTTHRRALAEWMLGSVGRDRVMRLPCPIAMVPESRGTSPRMPGEPL
jgi:hypothetical protein